MSNLKNFEKSQAQRAHDIITACADSVDGADTDLTTIFYGLEDGAARGQQPMNF